VLGVAVGFNQPAVVRLLLDGGADVAAADSKGSTALHYAAGEALTCSGWVGGRGSLCGWWGVAGLSACLGAWGCVCMGGCMARGADEGAALAKVPRDGRSKGKPAHFARSNLLPNPQPPDPNMRAGYGRREVAALLLKAGADLAAVNEAKQKPLDVAKLNGEKKMVEWLREQAAALKEGE